MRRRLALAGFALVASVGFTGCSQFAQLQPVAGDEITSVQIATNDVLMQKGVQVITWPTCSFAEEIYTCTGSAVGGKEVVGTSPAKDPLQLTVKVGGEQIFEGSVDGVIAEQGREK